jgi:micrococcal nuclease
MLSRTEKPSESGLACIDAPETDQAPHGQASTQQLSSLVPGQVSLNVVDEDRYGRLVAEVYHPNGSFINLQMVQSGHAVVYDQYLDSCGANGANLLAAEQEAIAGNRGVWADENFVMPWDHRQGVTAPALDATQRRCCLLTRQLAFRPAPAAIVTVGTSAVGKRPRPCWSQPPVILMG